MQELEGVWCIRIYLLDVLPEHRLTCGKGVDQIHSRFFISDEAFWEWAIGNSFEKGPATGQCIILFEGQILATCSQSGRSSGLAYDFNHPLTGP